MEMYDSSIGARVSGISVDYDEIQANSDFRKKGEVAGIEEVIITRARSLSPFRHF